MRYRGLTRTLSGYLDSLNKLRPVMARDRAGTGAEDQASRGPARP